MALEQYEFFAFPSYKRFEFFSEGPKGRIKKIVRFNPRELSGFKCYNLGFGDWDENKYVFDDLAITNNQDTKKILATVSAITLAFAKRFPETPVFATGSTPARTRLYQMGIAIHWEEIESLLHVFGFKNNVWEPFAKGVNYEAFFVRLK